MFVHPLVPLNFLIPHLFQFFPEQGTDAFSQSGLYSNHQDIAPRYSVSGVIVPGIFSSIEFIISKFRIRMQKQKICLEDFCIHFLYFFSGDIARSIQYRWSAGWCPWNSSNRLHSAAW